MVWNENQGVGTITTLTAMDNDEDQNGAPFAFKISSNADVEVLNSFVIVG